MLSHESQISFQLCILHASSQPVQRLLEGEGADSAAHQLSTRLSHTAAGDLLIVAQTPEAAWNLLDESLGDLCGGTYFSSSGIK